VYRRHFGCPVHFGQSEDGVVFSERDLACPIVDPDSRAYRTATSFIRAYGYGATMAAWNTDYLALWAGHDGLVRHAKSDFRGPAFEGDVTYIDGEVVDRIEHSTWGVPLVQVKVTMTNQEGKIVVNALNEVELPY
jgi:hypothetical protein